MKRQITAAMLVAEATTVSLAQTKVTAPKNKYSVQDDVKLGREAAAEVAKQMPMLNDERVDGYVDRIGGRLVQQIPSEFQHDGFR